jgi:phosphoribosylanthranilate isomerase
LIKIKICGITNHQDARCATEAGADFLGFIFYKKSPRYISALECASIVHALRAEYGPRSPRCVGVFVDQPVERVQAVRRQAGLDLAQLHGHETAEQVRQLHPRAFKAIRPQDAAQAKALWGQYARVGPTDSTLPQLLLDAYHPTQPGGTGRTADLEVARGLARCSRLLLAGGLRPENVGDAIRRVRPWGVDVSSGTERTKGRKDPDRVRAFVHAVREAEAILPPRSVVCPQPAVR